MARLADGCTSCLGVVSMVLAPLLDTLSRRLVAACWGLLFGVHFRFLGDSFWRLCSVSSLSIGYFVNCPLTVARQVCSTFTAAENVGT
jgi:hypothetical protein